MQINGSTGSRRVNRSSGGEVVCKIAASMVSSGAVIQKDSLRESKPELKRVTGKEDARINEGGVDSGTKGEIGNTSMTSDRVRGNDISNDGAEMATKAKADKMINRKEGRSDGRANDSGFQRDIVGTAWDMTKSGDQFSGAVEERMFGRRSARKSKQRAFILAAAWTAGAVGTRSSMTFAERPRVRETKAGLGAADELVVADMVGGRGG
jgi:hypothetical protein